MSIHILPPEIVARIAAGEVVERPASVVKELIENAIDAGASTITVDVSQGGRRRIQVADDGCGIPADEVRLAFARHATSKLQTAEELSHIRTLGFRGEALASIAAVARVTCVTRAKGEEVGTRLRLEGGQVVAHSRVGRPPGTVITVEDLFFNVPARRKFLRTPRSEQRRIDRLVTRYAMAYPHIRFVLSHDGREVFHTDGSGDLREVLVAVYGVEVARLMLAVGSPDAQRGDGRGVRGFVSPPALHRANRQEITLFVNGRWIADTRLTYAVIQAYHTFLPTGRYPLAVLQITLPPEEVDVNVHPAKTEVRFRDGDGVFRLVQRAVRQALLEQAPIPQVRGAPAAPMVEGEAPAEGSTLPPTVTGGWTEGRPRPVLTQVPRQEGRQLTLPVPHPAEVAGEAEARAEGAEGIPGGGLPILRVVGQLQATYIIAEGPDGMYLIDQHAAHERILYERFLAEQARAQVTSQPLLEPLPVDLDPGSASLVEEHQALLASLGFDIVLFGRETVLVRAVPAMMADADVAQMVHDLVAELEAGEEPLAREIGERIARRVCKRAAIKAGKVLSLAEMESLLRQLEQCTAPRTCPHGRPTVLVLSAEQLAREFGRTS